LIAGCLIGGPAPAEEGPRPPPEQAAQYEADRPKSILELQQFRRSTSATVRVAGDRAATATLVALNPYINTWFLLTLERDGERARYHLHNPDPRGQRLRLAGELLIDAARGTRACDLWSGEPTALEEARASGLPYAPLCEGRLYLRNPVAGRRTDLERVSEFLRDHVWGGEAIVGFVRDHFFQDAFLERGTAGEAAEVPAQTAGAPAAAAVSDAHVDRAVEPQHLGIDVDGAPSGQLALGRWYPATGLAGIHLSVMEPQAVAEEILESHRDVVSALDGVEASALDYLVAFDLEAFELNFALGTEYPRVGWSSRPPEAVRVPGLPGPDGIDSTEPLVTIGMVDPARAARTVATFTGGFKRSHGAFKYGDFATRNRGSHYGFIEEGVVFSKLQPGLSTLYVLDDGTVDMKTWSEEHDRLLARIRYARQNGVPLIASDPKSGVPVPGALVARWGPGNWSGSAEGELRTLRGGVCLQETDGRRFLIYGYFSSATPSAMARVLQAYGCSYAMHLDMNALVHTYLALYGRKGEQMVVQHLIPGMAEVDKATDGKMVPRFLGFPDNRDFFYLTRREDDE